MTTPTYVSPFTGTVVTPTDVSYSALTLTGSTQLYWPSAANGSENVATRIIDIYPQASGYTIALPDASQGTLGADILFRNFGSTGVVVYITDALGGASVTLQPGTAQYYYLTDNTTVSGTWNNFTFGTGTSAADAATLQGAGLTTINGQLATTQNIVDVTSVPTLIDSSRAATYNWGGGAATISLPIPANITAGWFIGFRNSGSGALTFSATSPATINGIAAVVTNPGDSGFILYDASTGKYITVGLNSANNITFTSGTYDVDAVVGNTLNLSANSPIIQNYIAQSGTRTVTLAVTLPAITQFYVISNNTGQSGYNVTFQLAGSSQTPISISTGNIYTLLSNGTNLYVLNQGSSSLYIAGSNGTAGNPAFSFSNDVHSGMYLDGTSVLGLSANSTEMLRIDNSNTSAPLITTPAQLNAGLISGGSF